MFNPTDSYKTTCKKHDIEYTAYVRMFRGMECISQCPACHLETVKEIGQEAVREQRIIAKSNCEKLALRGCFVPEKYLTRELSNYRPQGAEQEKALAACTEFAENFSEYRSSGGSLIFIGSPGTGKTHLSCAIANHVMRNGYTAAFVKVSEMIRAIRKTYRRDSQDDEQQVIDRYSQVDFLVLDEVGLQRGTDDEQNYITEIIDNRVNAWRPTILITNLSSDEMKELLGVRAWDRLLEGRSKMIKFEWGSYRPSVKNDSHLPKGAA